MVAVAAAVAGGAGAGRAAAASSVEVGPGEAAGRGVAWIPFISVSSSLAGSALMRGLEGEVMLYQQCIKDRG
jgi:hypothetical protein